MLAAHPATPTRSAEPRDASSRTGQAGGGLRTAAAALVLVVLAFFQRPGQVAADTKLDLLVNPSGFLGKALHMWDPIANAGQLQDQAYGYLFPMGPFFLVGHWSGVAPWILQRGWEALLLVVAFYGAVRVARALGMTGDVAPMVAGLAYSLAPRMLSELFVISAELLPMVVLPYVLLPLISAARGAPVPRAAARSGVALLVAGGVNASATLAVLLVPMAYLACLPRGRRRASMMRWWFAAVAAACLWWLIPLLALGSYSPPFLNWIESAQVTTSATSLLNTLRGVDHWQSFLGPGEWPGAWILASSAAAIVATTLIATIGLLGLTVAERRTRQFLLVCVALGVLCVGFGHVSAVAPPGTSGLRSLLDGPLNAFRNVHKFDPVLRLPIALGVGFATTRSREAVQWIARVVPQWRVPQWTPLVVLLSVTIVAVAPAMTDQLVPRSRTTVDASWWQATANWLAAHQGGGRALVLPGVAQAAYLWGSPRDDALQPYARSPWTVRDAAPLAQPGYVRLLDAITSRFDGGRSDGELSALLARSGIGYVVVRNDLLASAITTAAVHSTLAQSPGFSDVAGFGPLVNTSVGGAVIDGGLTMPHSSVEVYAVAGGADLVSLRPASSTVTATGSSDALAALVSRGLAASTPTVFTSDAAAAAATHVVTDGIRRREASFSEIAANGPTLTSTAAFPTVRAAHDYLPVPTPSLSTVSYSGIASVTASTSRAADYSATIGASGSGPFAAIDGDPATYWSSSSLSGGVGQWLDVRLLAPLQLRTFSMTFAPGRSAYPTRIRVTTDGGSQDMDVTADDQPQTIVLAPVHTSDVRVTVLSMSGPEGSQVAIADLTVPGVQPQRWLNVPAPGRPDVIAFDEAAGGHGRCMWQQALPVCTSAPTYGEEGNGLYRQLGLDSAGEYSAAATLRLRSGDALSALLDARQLAQVTASSTIDDATENRPGAVLDGSPLTTWIASPGDRTPSLTFRFLKPHKIRRLVVSSPTGAPDFAAATRVSVSAGNIAWSGELPSDGSIDLGRTVDASTLTLTVEQAALRTSTSVNSAPALLPVGISDVGFVGLPGLGGSAPDQISLGCGQASTLRIDSLALPLRVTGSLSDLVSGRPLLARPCGSDRVSISAGRTRIALASSQVVEPINLTMSDSAGAALTRPAAGLTTSAVPTSWGATRRTVQLAGTTSTEDAILTVAENSNAGWTATLGGKRLEPVMVDGWQQGWQVPAGSTGTIVLDYRPQRVVTVGLLVGAVAALLLLLLALIGLPRLGRRRSEPDAPTTRHAPISLADRGGLLLVLLVLVAITQAGFWGLLVVAGVVELNARLAHRWPLRVGVVALFVAGGVIATVSHDLLANSAVIQLVCLAGIATVFLASSALPLALQRFSIGRSRQ